MEGGAALRDLSLHLLDLLENSIAAGASSIWVRLVELPESNRFELVVDDNGRGLSVTPEEALNPFYTTKNGKRTGLGLALLRTSARQAAGDLTLTRSSHGGLRVHATLQLDHVDRIPLGDVATSLSTVACTHPGLEIICKLRVSERCFEMKLSELAGDVPLQQCDPIALSQRLMTTIRLGQQQVGMHG
jgi:hypothetical protein